MRFTCRFTNRIFLQLVILSILSFPFVTKGQIYLTSHQVKRQTGANWIKVEPSGAGFSVLMPNTPKTTEEVSRLGSVSMTVHYITAGEQSEFFAVIYSEYPPSIMEYLENANPEGIFNFIRDRLPMKVSGSKLLAESPTSLNGYPGREYMFEAQRKAVALLRAYWVKPRIYQLLYIKEQGLPYGATLENFLSYRGQKFLASFQVFDKAPVQGSIIYDEEPLPWLSQDDMIWLGGELMKRNIVRPEDVERFGSELITNAINYLSPNEQAEYKRIRMQSLSFLSDEEKENYKYLYEKILSKQELTKSEKAYSTQLIRKALTSLPKQTLARFQALTAKGVRVALRSQ